MLSKIAGMLVLIGYIPYITSILKGQSKPSKASWLIWAVLDMVLVAGMYATNSLNGLIIGSTLGATIVALLAIKYGTPSWTRFDKYSALGALLGIVLWNVFDSPMLGLSISLFVSVVGAVPTWISCWYSAENESKFSWMIFMVAAYVGLASVTVWDFANAAYPIIFTFIEVVVVMLLILPRNKSTV